jgi:Domain of unknown function (DUF4157)
VAAAIRGPAAPLSADIRGGMERRFGYSFADVRVHTDAAAAGSADEIGATAYTVGHNVVFSAGAYAPQTGSGRQLLEHELVHVMQQRGASAPSGALMVDANDSEHERNAEARSVAGTDAGSTGSTGMVQRLVRTGSVTCPAAATGIADPHTGPADRRASSLLDHAITRITHAQAAHVASPADADVVAVGNLLHTIFHLDPAAGTTWTAAAPDVALPIILRRLQAAKAYIDSVVFTVNCIPNGGAGRTIPGCTNTTCGGGTEAFSCHANPVELVLCPDFWALGGDQRGRVWMHEVMHITFRIIDDWGQPNVHNAHCYAQFVALLNGFNSPAGFRCA